MVGLAFYTSDLRKQTEEFLFDLTVTSVPALKPTEKILTLALDTEQSTPSQKVSLLTNVIGEALKAGIPDIYATYLLSEYDYQKRLPAFLKEVLSTHKNVKLLTLALNQKHPISLDFPVHLANYRKNILGIDALRNRSYEIVRTVPTTAYQGTEKSFLFAHDLMKSRQPKNLPQQIALRNIKINTKTIASITELPPLAKYDIILIGQKTYKPWATQTLEPTTVNTPYRNNPYNVAEGVSVLEFASLQAQNIVQKKQIHIAATPLSLFLQIIAALLFVSILLKTKVEKSLYPTVLIFLIIILGMLSLHFYSVYLPSADFCIFALFSQIMMVARFAENQFMQKEKQVLKVKQREKLDSVYSIFISDLAKYLSKNNSQIDTQLGSLQSTSFTGTQAEILAGTRKSSRQFAEFLEGISTMADIDMGKVDKGTINPVYLKKLTERIIDRFQSAARQKSIRIINYVDGKLHLKTNPEVLDTIIQNLISNSLKYSPKGGKIEISSYIKANQVLIHIKDYGYGIDKENQEKIFEKFYRVKDDHVYEEKGSGIGLYLSKLFANQLGGDVYLVSSKLAEGSTFAVKVPKNV